MVVLNPNNWHWVDKNTLPWTKEYMNGAFDNWAIESGDNKYVVKSVSSVAGDSNVSQRKGKVICYFDLQLEFDVSVAAAAGDGEEICHGTVSIPEFIHDESDFEIRYSGFEEHEADVRRCFAPKLVAELLKYQSALVAEHSKDVQNGQ
ncbi:AFR347Cp [Eremothecium gossypii ATCC 10895]|uniref:AFR347Cp n=1 Tax=Eremothecium gossypii (strain ATCC 10895 / CBS 109.51 / FGSC 9923 / NRRL Y-1056) TaxID=284811 RepID=Q753G5_EREGS|nr:AFR347Cp [Eremothecium gossypii ATCC 10895]AAS53718.1 AFR347Cp [Eremothecium gossypii ATCC 10895]AEY98031.1 FAFR347Cp [Eremothecium gossypii FDAG1]